MELLKAQKESIEPSILLHIITSMTYLLSVLITQKVKALFYFLQRGRPYILDYLERVERKFYPEPSLVEGVHIRFLDYDYSIDLVTSAVTVVWLDPETVK